MRKLSPSSSAATLTHFYVRYKVCKTGPVTSDERRARNEAMFRELNERMKDIDDRLDMTAIGAPAAEVEEFMCECGRLDCAAALPMSREEYEEARSHPTYFVVLPDHVDPDIEDVVTKTDRFCVVKKKGPEEEAIARETDPRAPDR